MKKLFMVLSFVFLVTGCSSEPKYSFEPKQALNELNQLLGDSSKLTILEEKDELVAIGTFTPKDSNKKSIQTENDYDYVINLKTGSIMIDSNVLSFSGSNTFNSEESEAIAYSRFGVPVCHLLHKDRCIFQKIKITKNEGFNEMNEGNHPHQIVYKEQMKQILDEINYDASVETKSSVIAPLDYTKEGYIKLNGCKKGKGLDDCSTFTIDPFTEKILYRSQHYEITNPNQ